ncbi:hypothetical protein [Amycolatopsis samaneae]|uniref:Uncharacterized protein n=1 Tax=Amycolatopsis samaneae TaxID=664691 RepID=A0ABW5GRP8_9PSEU
MRDDLAARKALRAPASGTQGPPGSRDDPADPPTVRNLRIDALMAASPRPPAPLTEVRTQRDFMVHLRHLVQVRCPLSMREINRASEKAHPSRPIARSTLGDLLARDTVPADEQRMRTLLTIVLRHLPEGEGRLLRRAVEEWLYHWRRVRQPPAGAPTLAAAPPRHPPRSPVERVLRALRAAEREAHGTPEAAGLARACRIVADLAE